LTGFVFGWGAAKIESLFDRQDQKQQAPSVRSLTLRQVIDTIDTIDTTVVEHTSFQLTAFQPHHNKSNATITTELPLQLQPFQYVKNYEAVSFPHTRNLRISLTMVLTFLG
jgi:hypothetical protein